ncbi:cytochrome P450 302a1, mitochondrial [Neodiprion pinetum]|uniref:cytochrome P450 302a1, mitochondrial n=1 Tax=Neodiprion pinetum TaxID=441929 RepID=UPI00076FB04F|nr:cytochrome P450 302a1, mitochondrial [Neodiprion pinetum]
MKLRFKMLHARALRPLRLIKRFQSGVKTAQDVKPFKDIPGPRSFPVIGTLYHYLPYFGKYNFEKLHENGAKKLKQYGPLVREEIIPGVNVLWVFRPEDIEEIFRMESRERGLYPKRRSHLALEKYRTDRPAIYNTGGLLPTNGSDWWRIRREFQKGLSRPQNVRSYLQETDEVIGEFIQFSTQSKHEDFLPVLSRLYLELTCLVAFDVRLHSFSPDELHSDSRSSRLIDAANSTNTTILKLDNGPQLWRFFDTPMYRKLCKAQSFMEEVAVDMVSRKIESMKQTSSPTEKQSLLEMYLSNPNIDEKDVIGMACDMLLAGMDTLANSTSFVLYHLAKNPEVQEKLHRESINLLPTTDKPIDGDVLNNATYTKAVIKETFRMNPISVGVGRILQTDAVLNGYHVPEGTVIVTQNQVICRLEENFNDPIKFKPERWIREGEASSDAPFNPFLVIPFGHGPRSCIARRLAEQNIQIFLLRICRDLKFSWEGKLLDWVSLLINVPNVPIKLNFSRRK